MRTKHLIAVIFALLPGVGCTARQLERDGNNFRESVCDLYTEQAMDNLIRAKTNQPFVHLVYRDLLAQTTDTGEGMLGTSTMLDRQTGPLGGIMRTVTSGFTAGGTANRQRQLSFHADPVLERPEVYEAFIKFASDPGLLVESDGPPACPVHLHRKRGKKHYWIPCEAGPQFLGLVLLTSFTPAGEPPVSPAYDVEIETPEEIKEPVGGRTFYTVTLKFKSPVPKGDGLLVLTVPGREGRVRLTVYPLSDTDPNTDKKAEGSAVERLKTQFDPKVAGVQPTDLFGLKGQLFSYKFPKPVAMPGPTLGQRVYNEIDRIRARPSTR